MTTRQPEIDLPSLVSELRAAQLPSAADRKRIREAAAISQREIARVIGVAPQSICRWESGPAPRRRRDAIAYAELLAALDDAVGPS